jgi:tetratricopeptide (TPR) repeat protein
LQAVDTSLKVLGELLFESGRYDFVIPENRFLEFQKNSFMTREMPWSEVKEICKTYNTDAVLSLDHFSTRIATKYDKESYFSPNNNGFSSAYTAQMMIYYEALFRIYDPLQKKILVREFLRDTLYWKEADISSRNLFENFTPVKQGLSEAGIAISLDFSDKIGTVWREERRNYFQKGNAKFTQANFFAELGEWENAMALWKESVENTNSKSLKSKAQFNIAVAYELEGDLTQAISWALISYNTMYRPATYEYLEILKKRKSELKKLTK